VCLSRVEAIGGWQIGHYDLGLDTDKLTTYLVDVKVTIGGHEGAMNLAVTRPQAGGGAWAWDADKHSNGCGQGHTEGNRVFYNAALGTWGRFCWGDGNSFDNGNGQSGTAFQTLPQRASEPHTRQMPLNVLPVNSGAGGIHGLISRGALGWIGVGYGPVHCMTGAAAWECRACPEGSDAKDWGGTGIDCAHVADVIALAIIHLPPSSNDCGDPIRGDPAPATVEGRPGCAWLHLPELPGKSVWAYDGKAGMLGYANMQRLAAADEFLVGYATKMGANNGGGGPGNAPEFRIGKINADGTVLATKTLEGTGWNEDDLWVRLAASPGCVAFPGVWKNGSAPYAAYGNNGAPAHQRGTFSETIHITTVCDLVSARG